MNINDWIHITFHIDSKISWPCPICNSKSLTVDKNRFSSEETAESKEMKSYTHWEIEWITYNFTGVLKCSGCSNFTMFAGIGNLERYIDYDEFSGKLDEGYYELYEPKYFQPTLNIFELPNNCPQSIKDEILNSFKLFWFDLSSCANKIRVSLEYLMNDQKVNKTKIEGRKRKRITLHSRIVEFKNKKPDIASYLESIKWIGNSGSHVGKLDRADILDAYKLLEFSLKKLYDDTEIDIKKISKEINSRRGLRKRK